MPKHDPVPEFVTVPPEFWANFTGEPSETIERCPGQYTKRWPDGRVTHENWLVGNFRVEKPRDDGGVDVEQYLGVQLNRADVERLVAELKE